MTERHPEETRGEPWWAALPVAALPAARWCNWLLPVSERGRVKDMGKEQQRTTRRLTEASFTVKGLPLVANKSNKQLP